jgi:hypothetical protein
MIARSNREARLLTALFEPSLPTRQYQSHQNQTKSGETQMIDRRIEQFGWQFCIDKSTLFPAQTLRKEAKAI